jgi:putative phage-type endonuclease
MRRIDYEQGSQEWLNWRKRGIGGSDAACILGENPWRSAYDLWCIKTGRKPEATMNAAMQRGVDMEPLARDAFVDFIGMDMEPDCYEDEEFDFLKCSVDGLNEATGDLLEIKCPGQGTHDKALAGEVPSYYNAQMQHCMMVTGSKRCYYFSYRPEDVDSPQALIIIERDDSYIAKLKAAEIEFWDCVVNDEPPGTTPKDYLINDDTWALECAQTYAKAHARYEQAKKALEVAKTDLLDCTDDGNMIIGNIRVTRVVRKGSIDYKKLHAKFGITDDVADHFRKPDSSFWKVTETK